MYGRESITFETVQATSSGRPQRRRRPTVLIAILLAALTATTLTTVFSEEQASALLAKEIFNPDAGPLGPITVIGDSVMLGSILTSPTVSDHLAAHGWGPIRARAGGGYTTGNWDTGEARASYWINLWRQTGWDPVDVVVNLGGNDSGFCGTDLACAHEAIMHLVDTIGPGHRIWWSKSTHHWVHQAKADTWNAALDQVASEREDFFVWDWPSAMKAGNYPTSDNIHLSPDGYRARSALMAHEITADLAQGQRTGGDVALPAPAGPPSELVPIEPTRIIDTRVDPPGHVAARTAIEIDVSDETPDGATAVAVYVAATNTGGPGHLTAYECSAGQPLAASANHLAGNTRGAMAIVPISDEGVFCLYTHADADLVVDLQAAFVPLNSGGLRFTPLDTPTRLVDTRDTGRHEIIEVAVPAGADAVSISLAAITSEQPGHLVAYPCSDELPAVATVNHLADEVISGAAFVPVDPEEDRICVYSKVPVDITIDLTGVFSGDGDLGFVPVPPTRMLDTRSGTGGWSPVHGQFQQIDIRVAPADARAVSGSLIIVAPMRDGYLRVWGCGVSKTTANVNSGAGGVLANSVTTGVSDAGRMCIFARAATDTVFDTTGWWVPVDA